MAMEARPRQGEAGAKAPAFEEFICLSIPRILFGEHLLGVLRPFLVLGDVAISGGGD